MKWKRREFLKIASAAAAKVLLFRNTSFAMAKKMSKQNLNNFPMRTLGRTGERVSIIAFGGIVVMNAEPKVAAKVVADSVERGINYFDVAPLYGDAESKLGPVLKPYRKKVFLACKTICRDKKGAEKELQNSLKLLQTDHFDLYQLHGIADVEKDVKAALSKDGAIQAFIEARKQGIIRYIGFSAHSPQAALAAMKAFEFDTVMYPVNFVCHYNSNFETDVLVEAKKQNLGILGIKAMARQTWQNEEDKKNYPKCWYEPIDEPDLAQKALSWSLAQGITVVIPPGDEKLYRMALDLAPKVKPLTEAQLAQMKSFATEQNPIFPLT